LDFCNFVIARPGRAVNANFGIGRNNFSLCWARNLCFDCNLRKRNEVGDLPSPFPIGVIQRLVVAVERLVRDDDPFQPFDRSHRVPTWNNRAQRKSMLCRKIDLVHFVSEQHIRPRLSLSAPENSDYFPRTPASREFFSIPASAAHRSQARTVFSLRLLLAAAICFCLSSESGNAYERKTLPSA